MEPRAQLLPVLLNGYDNSEEPEAGEKHIEIDVSRRAGRAKALILGVHTPLLDRLSGDRLRFLTLSKRRARCFSQLADAAAEQRAPNPGWNCAEEGRTDEHRSPCSSKEIAMPVQHAARLTTFAVAPDGETISLGFIEESGQAGALVIRGEHLKELMLTLPEMARQALRRKYCDPNLRLVYPVSTWQMEVSTDGRFILTLQTSDRFEIAFAFDAGAVESIAEAAKLNGKPLAISRN